MKVCAYVMVCDSGMAPNPFHGVCTLAVCTPNHTARSLKKDDFIIGIAGAELCKNFDPPEKYRLIYAMKIDKRITLDEYYNSVEFRSKIPKLSGSKIEMCGDNFYRNVDGKLMHTADTYEHTEDSPGTGVEKQDCDGNQVFIGKSFYYFGSKAPKIPSGVEWGTKLKKTFDSMPRNIKYIMGGRCKYSWSEADLMEFLKFLDQNKIDYIPDPVNFDWKIDLADKTPCGGCN